MATVKDGDTADRWAKALSLRKAGKTYEEIAAECGYSHASGAYYAVTEALKAVLRESADDVRTLEAERLDRLMAALWPKATGEDVDYDALDRVLKIMDRRAKLLGLDAPTKHAVTADDTTDDELIAQAKAVLAGVDPPPGG